MEQRRDLKLAAKALAALSVSIFLSIAGVSPAMSQAINWPTAGESFYINPPGPYAKYLTYGLASLWLSDTDQAQIWRIDPATGEVQDSIPSNYGGGIAFDGEYLWRAAYSTPIIQKIRVSDGAVIHETPSVGDEQAGLAWDGDHLWVATRSTGRIHELDPTSGVELRSFEAPGANPRGLTWWNGYLYHSDTHQDTIYQLEPTTGSIISKIATPTRSSVPRGLTFEDSRLWYSDWYQGIQQMVIEVSPDGRIIRSNPSLMMAEMTYSITNTGDSPIDDLEAYWAVPTEHTGHEIIELTYDPPPDEYVYDEFDQKIAHFYSFPSLAPGETEQVVCRAYEKIWRVNFQLDPEQVDPLSSIPQEVRDLYLVDADFLQITDPDIVSAAQEAIDGETNPYLMAIKIHDYVAEHMIYDLESGTEYDALSILHAGVGVCEHYATLFISLGRSVGLPTRFVKAFYYYENEAKAAGHVWAEAYIPSYGWIPFDPTRDDSQPLRDRYVGAEPLGIVYFRNGGTDDRYVSRWGRSWRTGGMPNTRDSTQSGWPPLQISDFSTAPGDAPSSIKLTWTNPMAPDLDEVLMKRKAGRYPASREDGTTVYWDGSPVPQEVVTYEDTGLSPGVEYFYAAFTKSATGIWRSKVEEGANAASTTPSSSETAAVFRVDDQGNVYTDRGYYGQGFVTGGADIAEYIKVGEPVEPGDVVELDPDRPGYHRKTRGPYSTLVAGVVSTAPGMTMGAQAEAGQEMKSTPSSALRLDLDNLSIGRVTQFSTEVLPTLTLDLALLDGSQPINLSLDLTIQQLQPFITETQRPLLALMGMVPVKATTENGPIKPGDLLTTSSTPGYAMRCGDPKKCEGAIIGKALEPLKKGTGVIKMLVMR